MFRLFVSMAMGVFDQPNGKRRLVKLMGLLFRVGTRLACAWIGVSSIMVA